MARTIEIQPILAAIEALQDDDMLLELYEILGLPNQKRFVRPSSALIAEMDLAEAEIERGEFNTHDEVMAEAAKWIAK